MASRYDMGTRKKQLLYAGQNSASDLLPLWPSSDSKALVIVNGWVYIIPLDGTVTKRFAPLAMVASSGSLLAIVGNDPNELRTMNVYVYRRDGQSVLAKA